MDLSVAIESILTFASILIAIWMMCASCPPRDNLVERIVAFIVMFMLLAVVGTWVGRVLIPSLMDEHIFETQVLTFIGVLFICIGGVMFCYHVTFWTALFCCTAGYTIQNLASGLHGLVMDILYWNGFEMEMSSSGIVSTNPLIVLASLVLSSVLIFLLAWYFYVRNTKAQGFFEIEDKGILGVTVAAVVFEILFDMVNKGITTYDTPWFFIFILKLTHSAACLLVLYLQYELLFNRQLQLEAALSEQMVHEAHRQYQFTKESIDAINARCHDIKHQLRELGENQSALDEATLAQFARDVDVYDSSIHTGNDALDTILTEKSLRCQREGITLSCIADGESLGFMSQADLYALFGNAVDNAINAVSKLEDPEKRGISITVRQRGQMVSIHVENYFEGSVNFDHKGMPISQGDKHELHGYGTRSMRLMVERYDGTISWSTQGNVFLIDALIPIP